MKYFPSFSCKIPVGFVLMLLSTLVILGCSQNSKTSEYQYVPDPLAKNWRVDSSLKKLNLPDSLLQKAEAQISDMYYHFYPGGRGVFGMPSADMEKNITWSYQGDSLFLNYEISEGDSATGLYLIKTLDSNRLILSEEVADFGSVTYYLSTN
jgi:hypothetical protein